MSKIIQTIKKYDLLIIVPALALSVISLFFVYSSTKSFDSNTKYIAVQAGAMLLGFLMMVPITMMDYEDIALFWPVIAGASIFIMILVLFIGIGGDEVGTKGWIRFGGIGIQPAEIVKICFIITLSLHISRVANDINYIKNVVLLLLHAAVPIGLVMLQPDTGTAMVYAFIFIVSVFLAGIDWRYILTAFTGFGLFAIAAWFFILPDYQKNRFFAFLNPEASPADYGYHVIQSKIAIGSGGLTGKGFMKGVQTQLEYLPEKQTDFIYAVIGEEMGMLGCLLVLLLLMTIIIRTIVIGKNAKTTLGTFICIGVASMWLFHTFENIGMTIGLMPVTGIPLPFVSYGGSSIVTNFLALGLVLNVRMRKKTINF
ncbi:MAG: rod shape-determining protein RodA [Eubacteriales bacterium]|jgi:rod shape determining protein RodA|nr:rod shape-determining protein RodA [Eubacteriales bacterium]